MRHTIARNAADGGYTKKFVARNVAEVGRDSTAAILRAILRATNFGVDTRCNSAIARSIARNIAPCIRTFIWLATYVGTQHLVFTGSPCDYHRHPCALDRPSCAAGILER